MQLGCQAYDLLNNFRKVVSYQYLTSQKLPRGKELSDFLAGGSSILEDLLPKDIAPMIRYRCPSCGVLQGISPNFAGGVVPCPVCQQKVLISAQSQSPLGSLPAQSLVIPPLPEVPVLLEPPPTNTKLGLPPDLPRLPVPQSESRSANILPRAVKQASAILILGAPVSIANLILWGILSGGICCFSPLNLLSVVWPILAIVQGIRMWTGSTRNRPEMTIFAQILLICNLDVINFILGITGFVLLCHPTARAYFTAKEDG